mgnify:CR=1 FL=1
MLRFNINYIIFILFNERIYYPKYTKIVKNNYIIQLDGVRFIGVFMVMIAHWLQWQWSNPILTKLPFTHGVILFFVLSGFLISRILFQYRDAYLIHNKNKIILVKRFYIRRILRIFPLYYLLICVLFLVDYQNTREIFSFLSTYTSDIYVSIKGNNLGDFHHFWRRVVEK